MPTFRYRAYDGLGNSRAGNLEAAGLKDAVQRLKDTGLYPVDMAEAGLEKRKFFGIGGDISTQALALVTRQLATLLSTGTTLSEALGVLIENTSASGFKSILLDVKESVMEGNSFARALEAHPGVFSALYRGLVASGEASGSLDKALPRLADYLEARARIIRDVKAALTYPILMSLVGAGVLSFLFIFVIPKITRMFEDTRNTLPLITRFLIMVTGTFRSYWPLLLVAAGASFWLIRRRYRTAGGKAAIERLILRLPWFGGLATDFYISNLARTLGSLLKGGVQMLKALEMTKEVLNHSVFNGILEEARHDCMGGSSLSSSLKKHRAMPPIVVHMISVGERSGSLDDMLLKTADTYELEFESGVKRSLNLLEPLLILAMGLVVGFIVLAILLPIFELNQIIR